MQHSELQSRLLSFNFMRLINITYGLPKQDFTAMIMFYKNSKAMVNSFDNDGNFFEIAAGIL